MNLWKLGATETQLDSFCNLHTINHPLNFQFYFKHFLVEMFYIKRWINKSGLSTWKARSMQGWSTMDEAKTEGLLIWNGIIIIMYLFSIRNENLILFSSQRRKRSDPFMTHLLCCVCFNSRVTVLFSVSIHQRTYWATTLLLLLLFHYFIPLRYDIYPSGPWPNNKPRLFHPRPPRSYGKVLISNT